MANNLGFLLSRSLSVFLSPRHTRSYATTIVDRQRFRSGDDRQFSGKAWDY